MGSGQAAVANGLVAVACMANRRTEIRDIPEEILQHVFDALTETRICSWCQDANRNIANARLACRSFRRVARPYTVTIPLPSRITRRTLKHLVDLVTVFPTLCKSPPHHELKLLLSKEYSRILHTAGSLDARTSTPAKQRSAMRVQSTALVRAPALAQALLPAWPLLLGVKELSINLPAVFIQCLLPGLAAPFRSLKQLSLYVKHLWTGHLNLTPLSQLTALTCLGVMLSDDACRPVPGERHREKVHLSGLCSLQDLCSLSLTGICNVDLPALASLVGLTYLYLDLSEPTRRNQRVDPAWLPRGLRSLHFEHIRFDKHVHFHDHQEHRYDVRDGMELSPAVLPELEDVYLHECDVVSISWQLPAATSVCFNDCSILGGWEVVAPHSLRLYATYDMYEKKDESLPGRLDLGLNCSSAQLHLWMLPQLLNPRGLRRLSLHAGSATRMADKSLAVRLPSLCPNLERLILVLDGFDLPRAAAWLRPLGSGHSSSTALAVTRHVDALSNAAGAGLQGDSGTAVQRCASAAAQAAAAPLPPPLPWLHTLRIGSHLSARRTQQGLRVLLSAVARLHSLCQLGINLMPGLSVDELGALSLLSELSSLAGLDLWVRKKVRDDPVVLQQLRGHLAPGVSIWLRKGYQWEFEADCD